MFRFNPFVRVGLCMSAVTLAWPVAAATDDGETMVVTASAIEQNLKRCASKYQRHYPARFTAQARAKPERCPERGAGRTAH